MQNMIFKRKLPIPKEIKEQYPLTAELAQVKARRDKEIADVFTGKSDKMVLIIGPCSADREDAVQECICKAWEKRDSLKSAGAFRAWVTRILINECYDICRRGSKIVLLDEMPEAVAPESGDRELRDAVMGLDEIYRMPILLFYVEGFSIREISRILQIPEGTVKSRLFAGRGKLREVLGEEVPV